MSILKFFKLLEKPLVTPSDESTNKVLLDPKGLLTKVLSSSAIKMVKDDVSKVSKERVLHLLLLNDSKLAKELLSTVLLLHLCRYFDDLAPNETSVRHLRNLYQEK